jgi:hypothetical protein
MHLNALKIFLYLELVWGLFAVALFPFLWGFLPTAGDERAKDLFIKYFFVSLHISVPMALYAMYKELHGKKHRITSLYPVFGIIFGVVVDMHGLLLSVLVLPNVHSTPLNDTLTMQFVNVFIALTSFGLLLSVSALGLYAMYYWSGRPMKGLLEKIEDDPLDFAKQRIGRNILLK